MILLPFFAYSFFSNLAISNGFTVAPPSLLISPQKSFDITRTHGISIQRRRDNSWIHNDAFLLNSQLQENSDGNDRETELPTKKKKKKNKIVFNTDLEGTAVLSSDGLLESRKQEQEAAREARAQIKSKLGVSSKSRYKSSPPSAAAAMPKKLSKKAEKIMRQRTANGTVDGNLQAGLALPENQQIQI